MEYFLWLVAPGGLAWIMHPGLTSLFFSCLPQANLVSGSAHRLSAACCGWKVLLACPQAAALHCFARPRHAPGPCPPHAPVLAPCCAAPSYGVCAGNYEVQRLANGVYCEAGMDAPHAVFGGASKLMTPQVNLSATPYVSAGHAFKENVGVHSPGPARCVERRLGLRRTQGHTRTQRDVLALPVCVHVCMSASARVGVPVAICCSQAAWLLPGTRLLCCFASDLCCAADVSHISPPSLALTHPALVPHLAHLSMGTPLLMPRALCLAALRGAAGTVLTQARHAPPPPSTRWPRRRPATLMPFWTLADSCRRGRPTSPASTIGLIGPGDHSQQPLGGAQSFGTLS